MVNSWELVGKLKASSYRLRILKILLKEPKTPRELEKESNIKISHVSKVLKELSEMKLIECKTPKLRQGKIYAILPLGRKMLKGFK